MEVCRVTVFSAFNVLCSHWLYCSDMNSVPWLSCTAVLKCSLAVCNDMYCSVMYVVCCIIVCCVVVLLCYVVRCCVLWCFIVMSW